MTGFGDAHADRDGTHYAVEIRSLNNRYFKPIIKLPESVSGLEPELESMLREKLGRGSITYILKMRSDSAEAAYHINTQALKSYLEQLQTVKGIDRLVQIDLASLVQLPGVCQEPRDDTDEIPIPMFVGAMFDYHWNDHAGHIAKIRKSAGLPEAK